MALPDQLPYAPRLLRAADTLRGGPASIEAAEPGAAAGIRSSVAALHKRHYGKGPTRISVQVSQETVLVLLHDALTPIERSLRDDGRDEAVHGQRRAADEVLGGELDRIVEEATGRTVVTSMTARRLRPEVCAVVFVLAD